MEEVRGLVKEVLEKAYLMSLATLDDGGLWVCGLVFVYDEDFNIYWISQVNTRHSKAVLGNKEVAASITVSNNQGEENIAIQVEGVVEKIEGDILEIATKHLLKRKHPVFTKEGEILKEGDSWYKLTPSKIQLIYEPLWGFTKKDLILK